MDGDRLRDRTRAAAAWLDATPSEVVGLVVLVAGAVAVIGVLWWQARPQHVPQAPDLAISPPVATDRDEGGGVPATGDVTVHVAGAVIAPGLVTVPAGARVADAIEAAGGAAADAVLDTLNLARTVEDGEQVLVPGPGSPHVQPEGPDGAGGAQRPDGRIDLNLAAPADLQELPGIGPVLAERIVAHRDANGPFREVGELREVSGIGEKTFQALAELVAV